MAASTATLAVGRSQPERGARPVRTCRPREPPAPAPASPETAARTRGSIWPEVGAHEDPAAARRGPPAGARPAGCAAPPGRSSGRRPSAGAPGATEPAVSPDVAIEPGAAVRRSDPLGLAPGESAATAGEAPACGSSRQERVSGTSSPIRASRSRTCAGLRRSTGSPGNAASTPRRARGPSATSSAALRGRGPTIAVSSPRGGTVDREPVVLELDGEQRGHRLGRARSGSASSARRRSRCGGPAARRTPSSWTCCTWRASDAQPGPCSSRSLDHRPPGATRD